MTVIFRYKLYHHQTENAYKIRSLSSYRYTQENRQSSLLDFSPLLSDGDWRLMWKASLFSQILLIADRFSKWLHRSMACTWDSEECFCHRAGCLYPRYELRNLLGVVRSSNICDYHVVHHNDDVDITCLMQRNLQKDPRAKFNLINYALIDRVRTRLKYFA